THNLGSVPAFCDRAVLLNSTVLAHGPTRETFTKANLERTFGGVLRHVALDPATVGSGPISILSDDESPLLLPDPPAASAESAEARP
ncbi:MAG: manganese/iron ABC transporter ATP-binding protein, partial [Rhizobiales bacterium]|nr:manganese/iron ABC transporter ATP-binding protein [Hyphomicrobiales bacterium]